MKRIDIRRVSVAEVDPSRVLESSGSVLQRTTPELLLSKQKYRQAEGIMLVRSKREEQKQSLAFSSRPFVLCGLPVRQPPKGQLLFERRNGRFLLQITGHPQYGLPFGQDRLVPIYLATLAVQQKSPTVRFRSGAEMLETFELQKGGKEYRRLVAAFERIFGATIFFGTDTILSLAPIRVGLEYRTAKGIASVHKNDGELMLVLEGQGVIVAGGTVVNPKDLGANIDGDAIAGGVDHHMKKGDWIFVPKGLPHLARTDGTFVLATLHVP